VRSSLEWRLLRTYSDGPRESEDRSVKRYAFCGRRTASGQPRCRGSHTNTHAEIRREHRGGRIKRLFSEYPFLERLDRAAAAGFEAVEFPEPYGEEVRAIRAALVRNGLRQVQFNLPWGDDAAGEVGIANNPRRRVEFRDGVSRELEVADQLGCPRLLCHVGITLPDVPLEAQRASVAENLRYAAEQSARRGMHLGRAT
jgi:Xylose isomerase-like TIM barrel